jgi:hypothetical protein
MACQTVYNLIYLSHLFSARFSPFPSPGQAARAVPGDYGFDFDGTELENEVLSQKLNGQPSQFIQPVEASEFEMRYRWFIS